MADSDGSDRYREQVLDLIRRSGVHIRDAEIEQLLLVDFGLGDFEREGVAITDIVHTPALRLKILVLLPGQTLPEHIHPPYDDSPGKEETLRVIYGSVRVYLPGPDTMKEGALPPGKEDFYTLRNENLIQPIGQLTIPPDVWHWFQAGAQGAVCYAFYPQAVESHNRFRDPRVPKHIAPGY